MKWVGIVGARVIKYDQVESDIRRNVSQVFAEGAGIVSGGALGVDFLAADEALKHDPTGKRIKILIPSNLQTYRAYFNHRAEQGIVTPSDVSMLMEQLNEVRRRNPDSLIELNHPQVYRKTFLARNDQVVAAADEIQAYQAAESGGTSYVICKAKKLGRPVQVYNYSA